MDECGWMVGTVYNSQILWYNTRVYGFLPFLMQAWDDANVRATEIASAPGSVLIHPFDHPEIW